MSILSRLFGGKPKGKSAPEPETHAGFTIYPEPQKESGGFRVAARIEKEVGGELRVHMLIRADVCNAEDEAVRLSILKSRQLIDQQGEAIFN